MSSETKHTLGPIINDGEPNCWAEEEFAEAWLREVLAKVRGEA